jgi:hypothetical protein
MRKKYRYVIIHFDMLFNLGILAAVFWLNIPGNGGIIAASMIFALMLFYFVQAVNKKSRMNMWLDQVIHKINMKSLEWFKKRKERKPIKTSPD